MESVFTGSDDGLSSAWHKLVRHNTSIQATGLDAWASRVKCPARFVSHLHDICIYMSCFFIAFVCFVDCSLL